MTERMDRHRADIQLELALREQSPFIAQLDRQALANNVSYGGEQVLCRRIS
jgi:hypothetical protein